MDKFSTIESRFKRAPVRLVDHEGASGVLRLRGRKSRLDVSSVAFLHLEPIEDEDWYDLRVRSSDGRELLLHHAITVRSGTHLWGGSGDDAHTVSVFPNIVVDDMRGLSEQRQVQRIQFRLRGLRHFFHYLHAEPLRSRDATPDQIETLRSLRYRPDREDGPFNPEEIYVVHRFDEGISLRVGDRVYDIWSGGEFSGGSWDRINARTYPVAEIKFDAPVSIDMALDRVWEWRRFFSQMAMVPLALEAISVRGSLAEAAPSANLYLPNLSRNPKATTGQYAPSPRHLAWNSWGERDQLRDGMQRWLEQGEVRRAFRARLDRVIGRMDRRINPGDLIDLSSAVDSLGELVPPATFPTGSIDAIIEAAHAAAVTAGAGISRERLGGLIGMLQRPTLSARFAMLGSGLEPPLAPDDAALLARSATRIRNAAAHGGAMTDQIQPRIAPTIEALAALCARFDLEGCGFPPRSAWANARTMTVIRFDEGLDALRRIDGGPARS